MTRQRTLNIRFIRSNISEAGPRCSATKLGGAVLRDALILAVLSALLLNAARPAQAQTETVLYNFFTFVTNPNDGAYPYAGLTADGAGNFYGTTYSGGSSNVSPPLAAGTVFELSPNGRGGWNDTTLYSFCSEGGANCTDGAGPMAKVIFDSAGNLYGTTYLGGSEGSGVVYELSPVGTSWKETVLYNSCSQSGCTDGALAASGRAARPPS